MCRPLLSHLTLLLNLTTWLLTGATFSKWESPLLLRLNKSPAEWPQFSRLTGMFIDRDTPLGLRHKIIATLSQQFHLSRDYLDFLRSHVNEIYIIIKLNLCFFQRYIFFYYQRLAWIINFLKPKVKRLFFNIEQIGIGNIYIN